MVTEEKISLSYFELSHHDYLLTFPVIPTMTASSNRFFDAFLTLLFSLSPTRLRVRPPKSARVRPPPPHPQYALRSP